MDKRSEYSPEILTPVEGAQVMRDYLTNKLFESWGYRDGGDTIGDTTYTAGFLIGEIDSMAHETERIECVGGFIRETGAEGNRKVGIDLICEFGSSINEQELQMSDLLEPTEDNNFRNGILESLPPELVVRIAAKISGNHVQPLSAVETRRRLQEYMGSRITAELETLFLNMFVEDEKAFEGELKRNGEYLVDLAANSQPRVSPSPPASPSFPYVRSSIKGDTQNYDFFMRSSNEKYLRVTRSANMTYGVTSWDLEHYMIVKENDKLWFRSVPNKQSLNILPNLQLATKGARNAINVGAEFSQYLASAQPLRQIIPRVSDETEQ